MTTIRPFYLNTRVAEAPEGWTHVVIVGVERVGDSTGHILSAKQLHETFTPREPLLQGFLSEGLARESVGALLNYWLSLVAQELEGAARAHLPIGSIWVALSDAARAAPLGADPQEPFVGVALDAKTVARIEAGGQHLPSLVRAENEIFADIRPRASMSDVSGLFEALVKYDKEESTIALHWVGHGSLNGTHAAPDLLVLGDADLGAPRYFALDHLIRGLERRFEAGQIFAFVDACRGVARDATSTSHFMPGRAPIKGVEIPGYFLDKAPDGRVVSLQAAARGARSYGIPFRPTFFTNALIAAFDWFGASEPFSGVRDVGDFHVLERAVSNHMFHQLMGVDVDPSYPDSVRHALQDVTGRKLPGTSLADHSGDARRALLKVDEVQSLLLVVHDAARCSSASLSPLQAFILEKAPPPRRTLARPVASPGPRYPSSRWSSFCRFGAQVHAKLVHPSLEGQELPFDVRTSYQSLHVTF